MGDLPEAGKFLFLSGIRKPEYQEAINIFKRRHLRNGFQQFLCSIPAQARRRQNDWPETVIRELEMAGLSVSYTDEFEIEEPESDTIAPLYFWERLWKRIIPPLVCLMIAFSLYLMILGIGRFIELVTKR